MTVMYRWSDSNRSGLIALTVDADGTETARTISRASEEFRAIMQTATPLPAARWPAVAHARAALTTTVESETAQRINSIVVAAFQAARRGVGQIAQARLALMERRTEAWASDAAAQIGEIEDARDAHLSAIAALQTLEEAEKYNLDAGWPNY